MIEKTYVDGSIGYQVIKGIFKGVSTSEIMVHYGQIEFLNAASRYEDSPGKHFKTVSYFKEIMKPEVSFSDRKYPLFTPF